MELETLSRVQRTNPFLGLGVMLVAWALGGTRGALSAGVGALIGILNFAVMVRVARGAAAAASEGRQGQGAALSALLVAKLIALFALVALAYHLLGLAVLPYGFGLMVPVFSCLVVGLWEGFRGRKKADPPTGGTGLDFDGFSGSLARTSGG